MELFIGGSVTTSKQKDASDQRVAGQCECYLAVIYITIMI